MEPMVGPVSSAQLTVTQRQRHNLAGNPSVATNNSGQTENTRYVNCGALYKVYKEK